MAEQNVDKIRREIDRGHISATDVMEYFQVMQHSVCSLQLNELVRRRHVKSLERYHACWLDSECKNSRKIGRRVVMQTGLSSLPQ
jgi:hypothetical protein